MFMYTQYQWLVHVYVHTISVISIYKYKYIQYQWLVHVQVHVYTISVINACSCT